MEIKQNLDAFRSRERSIYAAMAIQDINLIALAGVWPLVRISRDDRDLYGDEEMEVECSDEWLDMWADYRVDYEQVASLLNLPCQSEASRVVTRAIELRLVYPDNSLHGTLHEYVRKWEEGCKQKLLGENASLIPDSFPEE